MRSSATPRTKSLSSAMARAPYVLGDFSRSPEALRLGSYRSSSSWRRGWSRHHRSRSITLINMLKRRQNQQRRAASSSSAERRDPGSFDPSSTSVVAELGVYRHRDCAFRLHFRPPRTRSFAVFANGDRQPEVPTVNSSPSLFNPGSSSSRRPHVRPRGSYLHGAHSPLRRCRRPFMLVINALRRNTASEIAALSGGESVTFSTQRGLEQSHTTYL